MDDRNIWDEVLERIATKVNQHTFYSWFKATTLERDEGEYAYAGQLMLHGLAPYKEAYTMKLPGTYAAYAAIMALFGQNPAGIHLGVMLVNLGCIVLVFLLGRKLLDDTTGVVAAAVFVGSAGRLHDAIQRHKCQNNKVSHASLSLSCWDAQRVRPEILAEVNRACQ